MAEDTDPRDETLHVDVAKDKFIFDMIYQRHLRELERLNDLDEKASKTILFVGIILSLFSALIGIFFRDIGVKKEIYIVFLNSRLLLLLGVLFLAAAIFCSVKAFYVKTLDDVPNTDHLISQYAMDGKISYAVVIQTIGSEISDTISDNKGIIDEKANFIKYSLVLFSIGMGLIVLFICGLLVSA